MHKDTGSSQTVRKYKTICFSSGQAEQANKELSPSELETGQDTQVVVHPSGLTVECSVPEYHRMWQLVVFVADR